MLRVSPQKLNLLAQLIRGKKVATALADLEFSHKRISAEVQEGARIRRSPTPRTTTTSTSTIWSSPQAWVGKDMVMKRFSARARAAGPGRIEKPFSNITIVVREVAADEAKAA